MHYLGFVFVDAPTKEAVKAAMEEHEGCGKWDWYRCGGRWDGYLLGEDEMIARETDNGFNFADRNDSAERNAVLVKDLPADKKPHFFVSGWYFIPKQYYNEYEPHSGADGKTYYGSILPTPEFEKRFERALADNADKWCVVVDAHN